MNTWPGSFGALCAHLEAEAVERGVCPKIQNPGLTATMHACGKPLVEGTRYCRFHQHGV